MKNQKKFMHSFCCLMMLFILFFSSVSYADIESTIKNQITSTYQQALKLGKQRVSTLYSDRFQDDNYTYCGLCVGCNLQAAGVFTSYQGTDGNKSYDKYGNASPANGYSKYKYPGSNKGGSYTIAQICNIISEKNVDAQMTYTVFAFNKGSSSSGGQTYGHAVLVHCIYNGKVYYAEWNSSTPIVQTISAFASKYAQNGTTYVFDGAVEFSKISESVHPTSVSLNKTSTVLNIGSTETLVATVYPSDATNKNVTWTSSNTSVAEVTNSGKVTAKAVGTATITVQTNDGGKTATCSVTVRIPVIGIMLNKTNTTISVGSSETLIPSISPSDATDKSVTWTSSNPSVASVDSTGKVTANSAGQATITVKANAGGAYSGWGDWGRWTTSRTTIADTDLMQEETGSKYHWWAAKCNSCGRHNPYWGSNTKCKGCGALLPSSNTTHVHYYSDDTSGSSLDGRDNGRTYEGNHYWLTDDGNVTAYRYRTRIYTDAEIKATCTVTVPDPIIHPTDVTLNKTSTTLDEGGTETLVATVSPSNATDETVTWTSNNTSVATVDSNGKVTAVAPGTATITVKTNDGNKTATCTVYVNVISVPVEQIHYWFSDLKPGESGQITAYFIPSNATNQEWYCDEYEDDIIAVTKNGKVYAKNLGASTVTIHSMENPEIKNTVHVFVHNDFSFTASATADEEGIVTVRIKGNNGQEKYRGLDVLLADRNLTYVDSQIVTPQVPNMRYYSYLGTGYFDGTEDSEDCVMVYMLCSNGNNVPINSEYTMRFAYNNYEDLYGQSINVKMDLMVAVYYENTSQTLFETTAQSNRITITTPIVITFPPKPTPITKPDFTTPAALKTINVEAFSGIAAKRVKLGEKVTSIGSLSFSNCPNLESIYIPKSCTSIATNAFSGVSNLTIYGIEGSYAEFFAGKYGFGFVAVTGN